MGYSLREFRYPDDYAAACALWEQAGPGVRLGRSDTPDEMLKKLARDPDLFLVAEDGGQLIGTVIAGFDGRRGMVYHLAVQYSYRSQGIGGALMDEVERRLRAKGCLRAYLFVLKDNQDARQFYERRGWATMPYVETYAKDLQDL